MTVQEIEAELLNRLDANKRRSDNPILAEHLEQVPPIKTQGGLSFSMQASAFHYCSPRNSNGPYDAVELGFPSERVEAFMPYVEDASAPTETVYGWVPVSIIAQVIADHGGFAAAD
jgi:hypothetical protein